MNKYMVGKDFTYVMRRIKRARLWAEWSAKPWVDQIVRVRRLERQTYKLTPDGLTLISDGLSERENNMIRQCEEAIATINRQAERMAGVVAPPTSPLGADSK